MEVAAKAYLTHQGIEDESKYNINFNDDFTLRDILIHNFTSETKYILVKTGFTDFFIKIEGDNIEVVDFRY